MVTPHLWPVPSIVWGPFRAWCRVLLGILALGASGCLAPPALLEPLGSARPELQDKRAPWRGELLPVEQELDNGEVLRGLWLEAEPGAPVMLHLAGSAQSFTSRAQPTDFLFLSAADLGYSSLAFDYRGIGASDGRRDVRQLATDARAMWMAALERAGGDPGRVLVRATSIGAVALAELLEDGVRPRALLLQAPVEGRSVVRRFARDQLGWWAVPLSFVYRPISRLRLSAVLAEARIPTCAMIPASERWLSSAEISALFDSVCHRAPYAWERRGGDHMASSFTTWSLQEVEVRFLSGLAATPPPPAASIACLDEESRARLIENEGLRTRFEETTRRLRGVCARRVLLAVQECDTVVQAVEWLQLGRMVLPDELDPELERAWFDLEDPLGPLSVDALLLLGLPALALERLHPGLLPAHSPIGLGLYNTNYPPPTDRDPTFRFTGRSGAYVLSVSLTGPALEAALYPPNGESHDYLRRRTRLLMKLSGVPDRVVPDEQGRPQPEGWWAGTWYRPAISTLTFSPAVEPRTTSTQAPSNRR